MRGLAVAAALLGSACTSNTVRTVTLPDSALLLAFKGLLVVH